MSTANLIGPNHPSFGNQQAWFLFALSNEQGAMVRLLLVEARNAWAVQTLERVAADGGQVGPNCELISVSRHASMDFRSRKVTEVKYVDFMLDIVEHGRLMQDTLVTTSFEQSLSDAEKQYANAKLNAMMKLEMARPQLTAVKPPPPQYPLPPEMEEFGAAPVVIDVPVEVFDAESSVTYQQAMAALTDLGFKKPQVKKVLDDMGSRVADRTIEELIKEAYSDFKQRR